MATLAPLTTPHRQPFGILNDTKLRNLQSIKNRQNAIVPNSAPSLKRRAVSPELSDSENVDPNLLDSLNGKRKRLAADDDVSLCKQSRYNLHIVPSSHAGAYRTPVASTTTPRIETIPKPTSTTPLSAPAAAGRSPTRVTKRLGLLKPSSKRFTPPAFASKSPALSITAALNGTLANKKSRKRSRQSATLEETKPSTWFFDVFEEPEETQDYRMNEWSMLQSANYLDISHDESKNQEKEDRGKENIDPNQTSTPTPSSVPVTASTQLVHPKDDKVMSDEPRTPLGDLNPKEYYGAGLDATSVVLVQDDDHVDVSPISVPEGSSAALDAHTASDSPVTHTQADFTFEMCDKLPSTAGLEQDSLTTDDLASFLAAAKPVFDLPEPEIFVDETATTGAELDLLPLGTTSDAIEIWESESAKDENEQDENMPVVDADVKFDEGAVYALQEL